MFFFYVLKTYVKFHVNRMLFTIWFIIILDYKNSKIKHLIDDVSYLSLIFLKFCKYGGYKKKCNLIMELLKLISNKKNIEWSCCLNLQPNLLLNFVQSLIILCKDSNWIGPNIRLGFSLKSPNNKFVKCGWKN